jgi:hypothetical protein
LEEKPASCLLEFACSSMARIFSADILNEFRETLNETPHVLPKPIFSCEKFSKKGIKGLSTQTEMYRDSRMDHLEYSAFYSQLLASQWFDFRKNELRKLWRQVKSEFHSSLITKRERVD